MENEVWKNYHSTFRSVWEVSDLGNVKFNGKLIDFSNQESYYIIGGFRVHRAVAELFVPNPYKKTEVDHINGDKHDNRAINLRWVTHYENMNNPLTKRKISDTLTGVKHTPERIKHNAEAQTGKVLTINHKTNIGKAVLGTKFLSDGNKTVRVAPEYLGEFIDIGFHFGDH